MHGLIAALITAMLYGVIWLAIGSNLLVKNADSEFFGMSHVSLLVRAPVRCLLTGIDYMLSQPYIQSLSPGDFRMQCLSWGDNLFNYMIPGFTNVLTFSLVLALVIALYECIMHFSYSRTVINIIIFCNIVITGAMILIQQKLPYLRVFSYGAFIVTICICTCLERIINTAVRMYNYEIRHMKGDSEHEKAAHKEFETTLKSDNWYSGIGVYIPAATIILLFVLRMADGGMHAQLAERETDLFSILYIANVPRRSNIAALDCDQQYLLKFGWDVDCEKRDVTDADCVIVDKDMRNPGYSGEDFWKFYQNYETIDWDYLDTMRISYENEDFTLYTK